MNVKINFACDNCLNIFDITFSDIHLDRYQELHFTPEPKCPKCWAVEEVFLSDYGQEQIDHMIFRNQIPIKK